MATGWSTHGPRRMRLAFKTRVDNFSCSAGLLQGLLCEEKQQMESLTARSGAD